MNSMNYLHVRLKSLKIRRTSLASYRFHPDYRITAKWWINWWAVSNPLVKKFPTNGSETFERKCTISKEIQSVTVLEFFFWKEISTRNSWEKLLYKNHMSVVSGNILLPNFSFKPIQIHFDIKDSFIYKAIFRDFFFQPLFILW